MFIARVIHSVTCDSRIKNLMKEAPTAYSLLIMHRDVIYAVRDPYGNRPLCIGRLISASDENGKGNGLQLEFDLYNPFKIIVSFGKPSPFSLFLLKICGYRKLRERKRGRKTHYL